MTTKLDKNPAIAPRIRVRPGNGRSILVGNARPTSPAPASSSSRSLSKALLVLLTLGACASDHRTPAPDAPAVDVDAFAAQCGSVPNRPGVAVAFDGQGNATMSVATYQAITAYMDAASAWMTCKEQQP